jgi:hypothetical protein
VLANAVEAIRAETTTMKLFAAALGLAILIAPAAAAGDSCYYYRGYHYPYRYGGHYYSYRYGGQYYRYRWHGGYYNHRYHCGHGWCYR